MQHFLPDYVLIAELLGFGTGTVLSVLLFLLVRRSADRSPGPRLLAHSAMLWNVFGLLAYVMILFGAPHGDYASLSGFARAISLTGGALFPIAFLQLWWRPLPEGMWQARASGWLLTLSRINAAWLIPFVFLCPILPDSGLSRFTMHAVSWNAALLLTGGTLTQVRERPRATADRICVTLTLAGIWICTASIVLLERGRYSPSLEAALVVAKEQSPFLAILGALFFFARFRSSDVLIKVSLRVLAAVSLGVWSFFFLARTLPAAAANLSTHPPVAQTVIGGALITGLLLVFCAVDRGIGAAVDCYILRQPDFRETLVQLWERMVEIDAESDLFAETDRVVCNALDLRAARILPRTDFPAVELHAAANAGRLWELPCDDACRRILPEFETEVLLPVRVHGEITQVIAIAPGPGRRGLLNSELIFLRSVAGQVGRRLEALEHARETIERQSREARLRQLAAQAELKALRAQINPHFLFNSLNTIADLIVTDPPKAEAMTLLLSKVFRHVLMHTDQQLTRVSEEMEFLRTYLGIEQVRFGERLSVRMELDPAVAQEKIPSLILQPVVENAIKHGLAPKIGAGRLSITASPEGDFVRLAVEDDGVGALAAAAEPPAGNSGLGLKIIAERLRTLYHDRASLLFEPGDITGSRVTILIPRAQQAAAV
jgi:two-component system, LytTR family, sensor kinase